MSGPGHQLGVGGARLQQKEERMQMNTIKILLNFGQNNKQVNTLPPC